MIFLPHLFPPFTICLWSMSHIPSIHQAAASLIASYRWCLTGTPLQNKPDDIQSLFQFLRVHPVQDKSVFQQVVSKPIQLGEEQGLTRLRLLLSTVSLRRAKAIIAGSVPPKTCVDSRVRLTGRAEEVYTVLFKSARLLVKALLHHNESGGFALLSNHVLEWLLRLRQACCASSLVPSARVASARSALMEAEAMVAKRHAAAGGLGLEQVT